MVSSCKKDTQLTDYELINSWIEENMNKYYLWNEEINTQNVNKNVYPEQYFKQIICPDDTYSFTVENFEELLVTWTEKKWAGYAFALYAIDNSNDVRGKITYIVKDTPADKAGLQRGMIFDKINGISLSVDNYSELISEIDIHHTLTVSGKNYNLQVIEIDECPVFLDTIYNVNNYKIGYLVYNSFLSDNGDLSDKYNILLNNVFGKLKNENINELILDLRYNQEGNIDGSLVLASLVVKNLDTKEIFAKYQYNEYLQKSISDKYGEDYFNLYFKNTVNNQLLNNVGNNLNRIFILTSVKTGAIGEIFINGLKPFMDVIVIGSNTSGKNVFTTFLYEEDPEKQRINSWAIAPAVMKIANNKGEVDYPQPNTPDIEMTEPLDDNTPLGNLSETVLSEAMSVISGKSINDSPHATRELSFDKLSFYEFNELPEEFRHIIYR
jgi:C-terminal processing protease CtpA/Prc